MHVLRRARHDPIKSFDQSGVVAFDLAQAQISAIIIDSEEYGESPMKSFVALLRGCAVACVCMAVSTAASAQVGLSDPRGSGPIVSAVQWLQGTLLGTVATVVAVIAIACVGFMMLTGRLNWRYGAVVILGCFILFGAASIVAGIRSTAGFAG